MPVAVELRAVSFAYGQGPPVLADVDLRVDRGEFVVVAGPNGGGKTTLLRLALGLEQPTSGEALLFGEPARTFSRRSNLGYVAQRARLDTDGPATVREVVAAGRLGKGRFLGRMSPRDRELVDEAIARVGLGGRTATPITQLSGGQQQRAFIAKALAGEPELLVLDEPTTGVDVEAQTSFAALLERLHRELGVTVLYASHEFGAIEKFVERLVLVSGRIGFDGPPRALPGAWHDPSHVHV